jgi:hypothetical protein
MLDQLAQLEYKVTPVQLDQPAHRVHRETLGQLVQSEQQGQLAFRVEMAQLVRLVQRVL